MSKNETNPRPYVPSGFFMTHVVNPITLRLSSPTLTVVGRRTGRPISTPVPPFEYEATRYLVSGGGETDWVRNLRAASQGELRKGRTRDTFHAVECTATSTTGSWSPIASTWVGGHEASSKRFPIRRITTSSASNR